MAVSSADILGELILPLHVARIESKRLGIPFRNVKEILILISPFGDMVPIEVTSLTVIPLSPDVAERIMNLIRSSRTVTSRIIPFFARAGIDADQFLEMPIRFTAYSRGQAPIVTAEMEVPNGLTYVLGFPVSKVIAVIVPVELL